MQGWHVSFNSLVLRSLFFSISFLTSPKLSNCVVSVQTQGRLNVYAYIQYCRDLGSIHNWFSLQDYYMNDLMQCAQPTFGLNLGIFVSRQELFSHSKMLSGVRVHHPCTKWEWGGGGGGYSFFATIFIKTFAISVALRKADNGSVAVILIPTQALPRYHDFSIDSGISLIRMTAGVNSWKIVITYLKSFIADNKHSFTSWNCS